MAMISICIKRNINMKEYEEKTILFECDGTKDCSNKRGCYKNGGECYLTSDISYALNFEFDVESKFYIEGGCSNKR